MGCLEALGREPAWGTAKQQVVRCGQQLAGPLLLRLLDQWHFTPSTRCRRHKAVQQGRGEVAAALLAALPALAEVRDRRGRLAADLAPG